MRKLLKIIPLLGLLLWVIPAHATTPSMVTSQFCAGHGAGSASCNLPNPSTTGNTIVAGISTTYGTGNTLACSDATNGAYTAIGTRNTETTNGQAVQLFYFPNAAAVTTVTCTDSLAQNDQAFVAELQNVSSLTTNAQATDGGSQGVTASTSFNTGSVANTFAVGIVWCGGNFSLTGVSGSTAYGYLDWFFSSSGLTQTYASSGSQTMSATLGTSSWWAMSTAVFQGVSGSGAVRHRAQVINQ